MAGGIARLTAVAGAGIVLPTIVGIVSVFGAATTVGTVVSAVARAMVISGRFAEAITPVSPSTAEAASPLAAMRAPAAACGRLKRGFGAGAV